MVETVSSIHRVNGLLVHLLSMPARDAGGSQAPPVLFLHGFAGCAESWLPVWELLQARHLRGRRFLAPDIVGHGRTEAPADPERYRMEEAARDLEAVIDLAAAPGVDLVGYSMGGRLALWFARSCPRRVRRLVLESATAGIADPGERTARVQSDRELADWIEAKGIEAFVSRWEALPLFAGQEKLPEAVKEAQRRQRLANRPRGLANSLRGMGAGAQEPLWDELGGMEIETLLLAGEEDAKFAAIARRLSERLPRARMEIVPGAGHNVHLEAPERFAEAVAAFLSE